MSFLSTILETLTGKSSRPQTSATRKRKHDDIPGRRASKARKPSHTRALMIYPAEQYEAAGYYGDTSDSAVDQHGQSFDESVPHQRIDRKTLLETPGFSMSSSKATSRPASNSAQGQTSPKSVVAGAGPAGTSNSHHHQDVRENLIMPSQKPAAHLPLSDDFPQQVPTSLWESHPNQRAREILDRLGDKERAALSIERELRQLDGGEPGYAFRDAEIRDRLWSIMDHMEQFARSNFDFAYRPGVSLRAAFEKMAPETVKVIGCVASGGPKAQSGWRELFIDPQKRRALACAIIGNVLVEQVLQHLCFGGSPAQQEALAKLQRERQNEDGFIRNEACASELRRQLGYRAGSRHTLKLPLSFQDHVVAVVGAIDAHLQPILSLNRTRSTRFGTVGNYYVDLYKLVSMAGLISILMRVDGHTVYYFTPVFKDDNFSHKYMECFNRKQMEVTHPRERESWPADVSEEERRRARRDQPLIQISIMDGVTAYRRGGWETSKSLPWKVVYAEDLRDKGIRSRVLTHGWVYCRWGRPRRFDKGVPNDDPKIHGVQWQGGFVEFRNVDGVLAPAA